jgi:hypothetical protein
LVQAARADALDALRQLMEAGSVTIARVADAGD